MRKQAAIAKISMPRLFGVVARERPYAQLDANRGRPLIWLDSPPGAGKTALVASYLDARNIPTLWYQVDAGDNDPASVFHYLSIAGTAASRHGNAFLPKLTSEHFADLPAFARVYFRQLFSALPQGAVLVFDNYQDVASDSAFHAILRVAVEQVPRGRSIICISRNDVPSEYAQLMANGAIHALHWETIRLTVEETRDLARARNVTDAWLIHALQEQSEGWAAGITLMLERLQHKGIDTGTLPPETREAAFDYFASLIFGQLPESATHILLSIAFLPQVTASMAITLSNDDTADVVLDYLYRRRLFTDLRSEVSGSYVFHALFRDFLGKRAMVTFGHEQTRQLLIRSAQVLESKHYSEDAIELRIRAQDWTGVLHTLDNTSDSFLASGRRDTLIRWIDLLPPAFRLPRTLYWQGIAQAQTAPALGIVTLRKALEGFEEAADADGQVQCLIALLKYGYVGMFGLEHMDAWLDALLEHIPEPVTGKLPRELELELWGVLCSTLGYIRPWHPWTAIALERVDTLLDGSMHLSAALPAACAAVEMCHLCGNFDQSEQIVAKVAKLADTSRARPSETIWWMRALGYLRFYQARYEDSLQAFEQATQVASENGMGASFSSILLCRFMVEFRVSGWAIANETMRKVESLPKPTSSMGIALLQIFQARRAQHFGDSAGAADLAQASYEASTRTGSPMLKMQWGLFCAEILLAAGRIEGANELIQTSKALIERCSIFESKRAFATMGEAYLAHCKGNQSETLCRLREALALSKVGPGKYFLRFLETAMPEMFALALEHNIEPTHVQQLIRLFRLKPALDSPDAWPWPIRIHTLGRFEVRIHDKPLEFSRKVPRKTLALLKALVAFGGHDVPEQTLCDALWADEEADAAREALGITVIRLRKLLCHSDAITQMGGKLSLDRTLLWVDAWRFEERASRLHVEHLTQVLALYGGSFLPQDAGEAWSVSTRERLRGKFIHLLATHGRSLEAQGDLENALSLYFLGVDADPIVEAFHQGQMRCYQLQGRHTEAISAFRRLRQTLSAVLGVAPAAASRQLYEASMRACGVSEADMPVGNAVRMLSRRQA